MNTDVKTTERGFLLHPEQWSEEVAQILAEREGIELTPAHWEIIHFIRHFYQRYNLLPNARIFSQAIRKTLGAEKAASRYLYRLFPDGPLKQACKIGGLPKPTSCI